MRKSAVRFFLCACMFFQVAVALGADEAQSRVLVVYYSRTGHTQKVAEALASKFGADLERLIDLRKRTGPIGASAAGKDAIAGNKTRLKALEHDPADYETILIGGPAWFGNMTPAVRTFIAENDLSDKMTGLFGTCHLTGIENALKQAAELLSKEGADEIPTMPLRERELEEEVLAKKIDAFWAVMTAGGSQPTGNISKIEKNISKNT